MKNAFFGNLTLKKEASNPADLFSKYNSELNYIFGSTYQKLESLTVIEAERKIALQRLRDLTKRMQTNRLKHNAKLFCKYFTD